MVCAAQRKATFNKESFSKHNYGINICLPGKHTLIQNRLNTLHSNIIHAVKNIKQSYAVKVAMQIT